MDWYQGAMVPTLPQMIWITLPLNPGLYVYIYIPVIPDILIIFSMNPCKIVNGIRTGFQLYWKIIYSIVLQTMFHEYYNNNNTN